MTPFAIKQLAEAASIALLAVKQDREGYHSPAALISTESVLEMALRVYNEEAAKLGPIGDMPDGITLNGHLFVHVAACPCPRIQAGVERGREGMAALHIDRYDDDEAQP